MLISTHDEVSAELRERVHRCRRRARPQRLELCAGGLPLLQPREGFVTRVGDGAVQPLAPRVALVQVGLRGGERAAGDGGNLGDPVVGRPLQPVQQRLLHPHKNARLDTQYCSSGSGSSSSQRVGWEWRLWTVEDSRTASSGEAVRRPATLASAAAGHAITVSETEPAYASFLPCSPPPLPPPLGADMKPSPRAPPPRVADAGGVSSEEEPMERGESESSARVSGTSSDSSARVESKRCSTLDLTRWIIATDGAAPSSGKHASREMASGVAIAMTHDRRCS